MKSTEATVLEAIARHVQRNPPELFHWLRLERDLDMTPLELVLVALEIDERTGIEVAPEELAVVDTLGELVSLFVNAMNRKARASASRVA